MPEALPSYVIVSPVKDEAPHLPRMAAAVISQRHRPVAWIIVDDGSTDGTTEIARDLAADHEWIELIEGGAAGLRARGKPVVLAFKRGLQAMQETPEFVVKLDGDLFFPEDYFEAVAQRFADDPSAGLVGGVLYVPDGDSWERDRVAAHTVHGAIKAYRWACYEAIGGLRASMGWDGIDECALRARGWTVQVLPERSVLHYAPRGSKQPSLAARMEEGRGAHFMGYRWSFLMLRVGYRALVERPRLLSGLALFAGYVHSALTRVPPVDDPQAIQELRREQGERLRRLVRHRARTTNSLVIPVRPLVAAPSATDERTS